MLKGIGRIIAVLWTLLCLVAWFYWPQGDSFPERLHAFADLALLWAFPWAAFHIVKSTAGWVREGFSK
ncbi:hypothetical protein [Methylocapsa sp. S129]|uniref:hypothetical protein n=1 Tax=Methylocapsa sp. S129 TaxID=1641869 RepID=UPI00131D8C3E|nr:hypothetical protein [Methylocapsa sp. S129]